jgi:hypothetical protein
VTDCDCGDALLLFFGLAIVGLLLAPGMWALVTTPILGPASRSALVQPWLAGVIGGAVALGQTLDLGSMLIAGLLGSAIDATVQRLLIALVPRRARGRQSNG